MDIAEAYGLTFGVIPNDEGVGACLRDYGEFARPEIDLIGSICKRSLIDVGANIGAISLPIANNFPNIRVIAIEAIPSIFSILRENVNRNALTNITLINAAAGEENGVLNISKPDIDQNKNVGALSLLDLQAPNAEVEIGVIKIDDISPDDTDFVKIDVEGFEPRVLLGAPHLLKNVRPSWLVEVSKGRRDQAAQVQSILLSNGYKLYWFFSPFLTRRRPKRLDERPALRGDISILALAGEAPWDMKSVTDEWPSDVADFPYLADYGLISARPGAR